MSVEVIEPSVIGSTCIGNTPVAPTCITPTLLGSTCLAALAPTLSFFLQSDPLVEIFEVDFGQVVVGLESDIVVICRNTGDLTLYLCDFLISGTGFSYVSLPPDGTALEAGEETLVTYRFAPLV